MAHSSKLAFIRQKRTRVFLLAFAASLTIWLLINLSKTYERTLPVSIVFKNVAQGTLVKSSDSLLHVTVGGTGFALLSSNLTNLKFIIDAQKEAGKWQWYNTDVALNKLFPKRLQVKNVNPKLVSFEQLILAKKRVPVVAKIQVTPEFGYGITHSNLSKDSVFIYGPKAVIDTVSKVTTQPLFFENRTKSIVGKVAIKPLHENVVIHDKYIDFKYEIEQFTQGEFPVKIKIKNAPEGKNISIFPKEVQVQFQGALSQFSNYTADDFSVYVNVNHINESNTLPLFIAHVPNGVINARVLKKSVTYLVLEK